jgi:hypothetical protein
MIVGREKGVMQMKLIFHWVGGVIRRYEREKLNKKKSFTKTAVAG